MIITSEFSSFFDKNNAVQDSLVSERWIFTWDAMGYWFRLIE